MSHARIPPLAPRGTATADIVDNWFDAAANSRRIDLKAFTATLPRLLVAGFLIGAPSRTTLAAPAGYVAEAVSDAHRGRDTEADARRHPVELAEFAGLKPGDTVVDLVPGSGYFTRIFSRIVGPKGHVYAVWPSEYARVDGDEVRTVQQLAADPYYANVTVLVQPAAKFSIPAKADVVWTSQNFHDYLCRFMGPVDPELLARSILQALKPRGVFVVVDHAAQEGSGLRDTEAMHRVDPQLVKTSVTAAGFRFDGESRVLRNPADAHEVLVFDPAIRGHTDQFAYRFRAPD
jgi:predicted methyltransferase